MRRIVQLCGLHPSIEQMVSVEGAECWILGASYQRQGDGPWTRCFDVHPVFPTVHYPGILVKRPEAWAWYQRQTKPIYLLAADQAIPASVAYPRVAVTRTLGGRGAQAFSSSLDWMMALALCEGFDEIRLEGVRMVGPEEWQIQREMLAYWIGRAEALGVEVVTDPLACLCVPDRIYGYGEETGAHRTLPGQPVVVHGAP